MGRLTKAQLRVLKHLQDHGSASPDAFTPAECRVIVRLSRLGFITGVMLKRADITDAGRQALKAREAQ
jgi:hypothetical protein